MDSERDSPWYEHHFDQHYLSLYPHRDAADALRALDFLERHVGLREGERALDLCCGAGRHLVVLCESGLRVVGVDLSWSLLNAARRTLCLTPCPPALVQADMRRLPFGGQFDLVVNLFTSFGYFDADAENAQVFHAVSGALRPGGRFVLDFMNAPFVRATLVPHSLDELGSGQSVDIRRAIEGDPPRVVKRVRLADGTGQRERFESVRLFTRSELEAMLRGAGLRVNRAWGDFTGQAHDDGSPRCILLSEKV